MDINLKKMFDERIDKWGFDVLLINSSRSVKCKCFDYSRNEGDSNCKICMGSGKVSSIIKTKTIMTYDSPNTRQDKIKYSSVGMSFNEKCIFYFKSDIKVNDQDRILFVGWNNGKIADVKGLYKIGSNFNFRMDNGEIEANAVIGSNRNEEVDKYAKFIDNLPLQAKTRIENGGAYICPL